MGCPVSLCLPLRADWVGAMTTVQAPLERPLWPNAPLGWRLAATLALLPRLLRFSGRGFVAVGWRM